MRSPGDSPTAGQPQSAALLLRATTTVSTLDRYFMPPLLVAIAADYGVPLSTAVAFASAYFLAYGLSQPLWGMASDRFGRVRTMRVSLCLAGLFSLASAASPSILMLTGLRGCAGMFFGAAYPSTLIYVGDTVPIATRQRAITGLMVGVAVGTGLASAGGGFVADHLSWRVAFVLTGLLAVTLSFGLARLPEPAPPAVRPRALASLATVLRTPIAVAVLAFALAEGALFLGALTLIPAAVESAGASASVAGLVAGLYGLSVLINSHAVGRISGTCPPAYLIAVGGVAAVGGIATIAVSRTPTAGAISAILFGLAWAGMHSSLQTWATQVAGAARATMVSLFAGSLFVGNSLGTAVVGPWADQGRYAEIYLGYAALAVPVVALCVLSRARWRGPT